MLTAPTDATAEPTIITRVLALIHRPAMGGLEGLGDSGQLDYAASGV
jgi:hypothetical protein